MHRIVPSITSLEQHLQAIGQSPDVYRPSACPHCGSATLRRHGYYCRKADRRADSTRDPVPICRYCCPECCHTCSRLPLCIAPHRWYDWTVQQGVLKHLLSGRSVHRSSRSEGLDRRTVQRWRDWLKDRSETFTFYLRSRFPEWGRSVDACSFWRLVLDSASLAQAMAWLDREIAVP